MAVIEVAIVGANTDFGENLLAMIANSALADAVVHALSYDSEAGDTAMLDGRPLAIHPVEGFDFTTVQIVFISSQYSEQYHQGAIDAASFGCVVIDQGAWHKHNQRTPLVVPDLVNQAYWEPAETNLVSSPQDSVVVLAKVLQPVHELVGITRAHIVHFRPVSADGKQGTADLAGETARLLNAQPSERQFYKQQIAFNLLPAEASSGEYASGEVAFAEELQQLLGDGVLIDPSFVTVPVFYGALSMVHIETRAYLSAEDLTTLIKSLQNVTLVNEAMPTPLDAASKDKPLLGGIRPDRTDSQSLAFWLAADNNRAGGANNCLQIADFLLKNHF